MHSRGIPSNGSSDNKISTSLLSPFSIETRGNTAFSRAAKIPMEQTSIKLPPSSST